MIQPKSHFSINDLSSKGLEKGLEKDLEKGVVDIYMPLDERDAPNRTVWPVAQAQLHELVTVIESLGWRANLLNGDKPVASVAEGVRVIRGARGERFINFMAGWAYPDFSVTPMWQLPPQASKLLLGSSISDYPGAVGLLAAASGTAHVGLATSRLFVEHFLFLAQSFLLFVELLLLAIENGLETFLGLLALVGRGALWAGLLQ